MEHIPARDAAEVIAEARGTGQYEGTRVPVGNGVYVHRDVIGTPGYEMETRGAAAHGFDVRTGLTADAQHERDLELAIAAYKQILGDSA